MSAGVCGDICAGLQRLCAQDVASFEFPKALIGSKMNCVNVARFEGTSLARTWDAFEKTPDLVFFPVSMQLSGSSVMLRVDRDDGSSVECWTPKRIRPYVSIVTSFPTLDDMELEDSFGASDYFSAIEREEKWMSASGANVPCCVAVWH